MENGLRVQSLQEAPVLTAEGLEVNIDGFKPLRDVNFRLYRGELRFLIGPSGAGKTMLFDVICGKVKLSRGYVHLQGAVDLTRYTGHRIARMGVKRKFNAPSVLMNLSVLDNLLLSMKQSRGLYDVLRAKTDPKQRERMYETLKLIGLEGRGQDQAGVLTHGEKQWLEIGIMLIQEPEVLLLDEPTAGMTDVEKEKTGELLRRISSNQAVIVVERDLEFVRRYAETVSVMHEGTIIMDGTMDEVQKNDKAAAILPERNGVPDTAHADCGREMSVASR